MKYLNALLRGEEIPRHTREKEPTKPTKPVLSVLSGAHSRSTGETERPEAEPAAVTWLRSKLTPDPQHIAPLIAEWVGERDGASGRWIDDLITARWTLGVEAYVGEDERYWWWLPRETVQ